MAFLLAVHILQASRSLYDCKDQAQTDWPGSQRGGEEVWKHADKVSKGRHKWPSDLVNLTKLVMCGPI